jgi:hypothetical protein
VKNLFTPFRGVRTQFKYRRSFRNFHAEFSVSGGRRLDVGKRELQAQRAVFTAKYEFGSFEQGFPTGLLLAKTRYAIRFIPQKFLDFPEM